MKVQLLLHKKWKYELLSAKILSVIAAFPKLSRGKRRLWCHLFNFWALRLLKFFVISTHPPGFKQSLIKSLRETFYNQKTRSYSKNTWNTNKDDRWMMDNFKDTVKNLTMSPTPQTWDRVRHEGKWPGCWEGKEKHVLNRLLIIIQGIKRQSQRREQNWMKRCTFGQIYGLLVHRRCYLWGARSQASGEFENAWLWTWL